MILFFYLIKELIHPLLLSVGVIGFILMMDQFYKFIPFFRSSGVEVKYFFYMMLYSLPTILMIAMPIGLMIATYAGINRVSADYEIIAMRAAGVSLSFLFKPVLALASIVTLVVLAQTFYLSPMALQKLEALKFEIISKQTKLNLTPGRINDFFGHSMIYITSGNHGRLKGILIADWKQPMEKTLIEAKSGRIRFDNKNQQVRFVLNQGRLHYWTGKNYRITEFERLDYNLAPPEADYAAIPRRFRKDTGNIHHQDTEMTVSELMAMIDQLEPESKLWWEYVEEFHVRIVTVLACLCLSIFALPMGIHDPRNPKSGKFLYMIAMMILYFWLYSRARVMVGAGQTRPFAMYVPALLVSMIGLVNFFKINYDLSSLFEFLHLGRIKNLIRPNIDKPV